MQTCWCSSATHITGACIHVHVLASMLRCKRYFVWCTHLHTCTLWQPDVCISSHTPQACFCCRATSLRCVENTRVEHIKAYDHNLFSDSTWSYEASALSHSEQRTSIVISRSTIRIWSSVPWPQKMKALGDWHDSNPLINVQEFGISFRSINLWFCSFSRSTFVWISMLAKYVQLRCLPLCQN